MFKHAYSSFAQLLRFDLVRASRIHPLHLALPISLPMVSSVAYSTPVFLLLSTPIVSLQWSLFITLQRASTSFLPQICTENIALLQPSIKHFILCPAEQDVATVGGRLNWRVCIRSEMAATDLAVAVRLSNLKAKDSLAGSLIEFVQDAKKAGRGYRSSWVQKLVVRST